MSGFITQGSGKYEKSIAEARQRSVSIRSTRLGVSILPAAIFALGRLGKAQSALQLASTRRLEIPEVLLQRYYILRG
jgi:hypothetical protein